MFVVNDTNYKVNLGEMKRVLEKLLRLIVGMDKKYFLIHNSTMLLAFCISD